MTPCTIRISGAASACCTWLPASICRVIAWHWYLLNHPTVYWRFPCCSLGRPRFLALPQFPCSIQQRLTGWTTRTRLMRFVFVSRILAHTEGPAALKDVGLTSTLFLLLASSLCFTFTVKLLFYFSPGYIACPSFWPIQTLGSWNLLDIPLENMVSPFPVPRSHSTLLSQSGVSSASTQEQNPEEDTQRACAHIYTTHTVHFLLQPNPCTAGPHSFPHWPLSQNSYWPVL